MLDAIGLLHPHWFMWCQCCFYWYHSVKSTHTNGSVQFRSLLSWSWHSNVLKPGFLELMNPWDSPQTYWIRKCGVDTRNLYFLMLHMWLWCSEPSPQRLETTGTYFSCQLLHRRLLCDPQLWFPPHHSKEMGLADIANELVRAQFMD